MYKEEISEDILCWSGEGQENQLFLQKLLLIGLFLLSKISVEMCVLVWKFEAFVVNFVLGFD